MSINKKNKSIFTFVIGFLTVVSMFLISFYMFMHVYAADEKEKEEKNEISIIRELFKSLFDSSSVNSDADSTNSSEYEQEMQRRITEGESLEGLDPNDPSTWGGETGSSSSTETDYSNTSEYNTTSGNFNGHYCQCDPQWTTFGNCTCNSGCGPTSVAGILSHLGVETTPQEAVLALFQEGCWNCYVGFYPYCAINSKFFKKKGVFVGPNISRGGRLNLIEAKKYIDEGALILCSSNSLYHVFFVSDVDVESGTMTTHDSWLGCGSGNGVSPARKISTPYDLPSYCDKYAYPIMKK